MTPIRLRLREAREARGLSQSALAALSGVGRVTVNRIENYKVTAIDLGVLEKLGAALGMDPAMLLTTEPAAASASRKAPPARRGR
jgi:transcriptional regulator with XRE-family HTH domain